MASRAVIPFLVAMMLVTGVCNTLLTKYQVRPLSPSFHMALSIERLLTRSNLPLG